MVFITPIKVGIDISFPNALHQNGMVKISIITFHFTTTSPYKLHVRIRDWSLITGRGGATKREGGGGGT